VTPTASLEAFHETEMLVAEAPVTDSPPGVVGAVVSAPTAALGAVLAARLPEPFSAITRARILLPTSAAPGRYVLPVAPAIVEQLAPAASQRRQR
jgi:hypothetical protein